MSTENLTWALSNMMQSGDFSDLKFVCQGQEFKVHKAIVCGQSPVINAAVQGGFEACLPLLDYDRLWRFIDLRMQESRTDVVNMDKFHPNTVKQLVKFLYSGDYDDCEHEREAPPANASDEDEGDIQAGVKEEKENNPEPGSASEPSPPASMAVASLSHHVCVNSIGDYYGVSALVALANTKIRGLVQGMGKDEIWVPRLPAVTGDAIESTGDDGLMRILASATAENISTLVNIDEFTNLEPVSGFPLEVLKCCDQRIQDLTEELKHSRLQFQELERDLAVEARNFESKIKERDGKISEFNKCLEALERRDSCRNCNFEFGCSISPYERILRCRKCRCRHYD